MTRLVCCALLVGMISCHAPEGNKPALALGRAIDLEYLGTVRAEEAPTGLSWSSDGSSIALSTYRDVGSASLEQLQQAGGSVDAQLWKSSGTIATGHPALGPFLLAGDDGISVVDKNGEERSKLGRYQHVRCGALHLSSDGQQLLIHDGLSGLRVVENDEVFRPEGGLLLATQPPHSWNVLEELFVRPVQDVIWLENPNRLMCAWIGGAHGESGGIVVFDLEGNLVQQRSWQQLEGRPRSLLLSPNGERLIASISPYYADRASYSPRIIELDLRTLEILRSEPRPAVAPELIFLDDATLLAVHPMTPLAQLELWDAATLSARRSLEIVVGFPWVVSPDLEHLALASSEGSRIYRIVREAPQAD